MGRGGGTGAVGTRVEHRAGTRRSIPGRCLGSAGSTCPCVRFARSLAGPAADGRIPEAAECTGRAEATNGAWSANEAISRLAPQRQQSASSSHLRMDIGAPHSGQAHSSESLGMTIALPSFAAGAG